MVIVSIVLLMGVLLSLDIHKAGKPAGDNKPNRMPSAQVQAVPVLNLDSMQSKDLSVLSPEQAKVLNQEKEEAKKNPGFETYTRLGDTWNKSSKSVWAGHYYFKAAELKPGLENWLKAGDALNESLSNNQDTSSARLIFTESTKAFSEAIKLDSTNLDAKTGLGVAYVAGGDNPMQGIGLLLGVVSKDPNNIKANFSLGLFSMKSGQYQKAINRFKTVVSQKPGAEAYFYLAQAYQNLNLKKEAIDAYLQSKKYIDDAQTLTSIDHLIKELTN